MQTRFQRKAAPYATIGLAIVLFALKALGQQHPQQAVAPHAQVRDGDYLTNHIEVSFAPLPSPWVSEQNVMDPIWKALGHKGVNFYAYGGPSKGHDFAARSDPDSPLYQAWFGAYVIDAGKAIFGARDKDWACRAFSDLGEYDQRSWLEAMGDPHALAASVERKSFSTIPIAGSERAACSFEMKTHSDLGPGATPLGNHLGMPPAQKWQDRLTAFHDLTLHVVGAWWYDSRHDIAIIVYSASSKFTDQRGITKDNGPALEASFRKMMSRTHLRVSRGT
jgi:hypothetical protein